MHEQIIGFAAFGLNRKGQKTISQAPSSVAVARFKRMHMVMSTTGNICASLTSCALCCPCHVVEFLAVGCLCCAVLCCAVLCCAVPLIVDCCSCTGRVTMQCQPIKRSNLAYWLGPLAGGVTIIILFALLSMQWKRLMAELAQMRVNRVKRG